MSTNFMNFHSKVINRPCSEYEELKAAKKLMKKKKKNKLEHQDTLYLDATDRSFGSNPNLRGSQKSLHASSPKSSIPFAGAQ